MGLDGEAAKDASYLQGCGGAEISCLGHPQEHSNQLFEKLRKRHEREDDGSCGAGGQMFAVLNEVPWIGEQSQNSVSDVVVCASR